MEDLSFVQKIAVWALPVLFAITLHEVAHGWVASLCGDMTAKRLGRLSLNPLHHIDPVGTLLVPGIMMLLPGGFIFGWAKPVPVDFNRLHNPRRDMVLVALAGPMANLLMAFGWALVTRLAMMAHTDVITRPLGYMGMAGIVINIILMVLNLFPLPPLDGGRIAVGLLPPRLGESFSRLEPYGFPILLTLLVTGLLPALLGGPASALQRLLFAVAGL